MPRHGAAKPDLDVVGVRPEDEQVDAHGRGGHLVVHLAGI
jgi:hypothetical protein